MTPSQRDDAKLKKKIDSLCSAGEIYFKKISVLTSYNNKNKQSIATTYKKSIESDSSHGILSEMLNEVKENNLNILGDASF